MKSCTFGDHILLVHGSCLILRLNSLLSVSEEKRATLTGAGAGAGTGLRAAAGLSGTLGIKAGGQQWHRRSGPAGRLLRGWTGNPAQLWSGDDKVERDYDGDGWTNNKSRHRGLAAPVPPTVRSPFSIAVRSLAPAAMPGAKADRPHGSGGSSSRSTPLDVHSSWQRF